MARKDPGASARQDLTVSPRNVGVVTYDKEFLAANGTDTVISIGIWCGAAGDLYFTLPDGTIGSYPGVQAGSMVPVQATKVNTTNTSIAAASLRYVY